MCLKKFIVITSINEPTKAIKLFSALADWHLIVVGDQKTPKNWDLPNVTYLSPETQTKLGFEITKTLPWNHYCRKMIGYLCAMQNGADLIADSDDDNEPYNGWGDIPKFDDTFNALSGVKFTNIYKYYSDEFVWPRGYPLNLIASGEKPIVIKKNFRVGVWQFLANEEPDVDAIYRLTNNKQITFINNGQVVLDKGTVCPFNTQNTVFRRELFPLMYLPSFVTFRFTDILRGLVAQPIIWKYGYNLGFGPATVIQKRNPHDYMKDFESEIPVYLESENVIDVGISSITKQTVPIEDQLLLTYIELKKRNIVSQQEIYLLKAWIKDIKLLLDQSQ